MTRSFFLDYYGSVISFFLFLIAVFLCLTLNTLNHSLTDEVRYLKWELELVKHQRDLSAIEATKEANRWEHEPEASGQEVRP